jgi:hypothetical protein
MYQLQLGKPIKVYPKQQTMTGAAIDRLCMSPGSNVSNEPSLLRWTALVITAAGTTASERGVGTQNLYSATFQEVTTPSDKNRVVPLSKGIFPTWQLPASAPLPPGIT